VFPVSAQSANRSFGLLFAAICAAAAGHAWYRQKGAPVVGIWLGAALLILGLALLAPGVLAPFNRAWRRLSELLGRVVSPVVLGVLYFLLLVPAGLLGRLFGRDELRLKKQPGHSHWLARDPPGPAPDSLKHQF
jgi:hypothetical protein